MNLVAQYLAFQIIVVYTFQSLCQDLCNIYDPVMKSQRKIKVLIGSTSKYLSIFLNWWLHFKKVCMNDDILYFVCFDTKVGGFYEQN